MPIQDEKHEVVLFLCSHKDITRQKLHEHKAALLQHQQQLLLQQQQHAADSEAPQGGGEQQAPSGPTQVPKQQLQQPSGEQQQQQVANSNGAATNLIANPARRESGDQQALLSLDEFKLDELPDAGADFYSQPGAQDDEFGPYDDDDDEADGSEPGHKQDKHTASQYSRRRSRAVLYQLSGHYGYRRSVNMKSKLKLNNVSCSPPHPSRAPFRVFVCQASWPASLANKA